MSIIIIIIIIIIIHSCFLMCRVNSQKANYRNSATYRHKDNKQD